MLDFFGILAFALSLNFLSIDAGRVFFKNVSAKRVADLKPKLLDTPPVLYENSLRMGRNTANKLPFGHMNSIPLNQYAKIYFVMDSDAVKNVDNQRALTDLVKKIMSASRHRGDVEPLDSNKVDIQTNKIDDKFDETRLAPVTMKAIGRLGGGSRTAKPIARTYKRFSEDEYK